MRSRSMALSAVWAVGTFAVILAVGWPKSLNAIDQPGPTPKVAPKPVLTVDGIELSLDGRWPATQPADLDISSDKPWTLHIAAVNRSEYGSKANYTVKILTPSLRSMVSRVATFNDVWSSDSEVNLNDGESTKQEFQVPPIPAGKQINIMLSSGNQQIFAAVIFPPAKPSK